MQNRIRCPWKNRKSKNRSQMSYRALVEILFNLNIDFLSNCQSLIETLSFLCHISMFRAGDFLIGRPRKSSGGRRAGPRTGLRTEPRSAPAAPGRERPARFRGRRSEASQAPGGPVGIPRGRVEFPGKRCFHRGEGNIRVI